MKDRLVEVLRMNPQKRAELKRAISENGLHVRVDSKHPVVLEAILLMGNNTSIRETSKHALVLLIESAIEESMGQK